MARAGKRNILVIWGDDIGITNLSCYSDGVDGVPDAEHRPDCRRGDAVHRLVLAELHRHRSSFITGQSVYRTGLSKVGVPGMDVGLQAEDVTIAELLKPHGYATGQFGKNHLGDLNKYLPTVHGFDEFFGNLYHLNAEESRSSRTGHPPRTSLTSESASSPRGVIHSWATEEDDNTEEPRFGCIGKQRIEDTGPLTKKRMETIDDETVAACIDFIKRQQAADTPFVWMNTTYTHLRTHTKPESPAMAAGSRSYHDTMIDHDKHVGLLLDTLDELGIAEDTIVIYFRPTTART